MWDVLKRDIAEFVNTVKAEVAAPADDDDAAAEAPPAAPSPSPLAALRADRGTWTVAPSAPVAELDLSTPARVAGLASALGDAAVASAYHDLVDGGSLSHGEFWQRYFYRVERLSTASFGGGSEHDAEDDEDLGWGDDEDVAAPPPLPPANTAAAAAAAASPAAKLSSELSLARQQLKDDRAAERDAEAATLRADLAGMTERCARLEAAHAALERELAAKNAIIADLKSGADSPKALSDSSYSDLSDINPRSTPSVPAGVPASAAAAAVPEAAAAAAPAALAAESPAKPVVAVVAEAGPEAPSGAEGEHTWDDSW